MLTIHRLIFVVLHEVISVVCLSPGYIPLSTCLVPGICVPAVFVQQNELVSTLYKEDLTGELMRETDDVAERRRISRDMLSLLKKAVSIVSEVRDFNPFLG